MKLKRSKTEHEQIDTNRWVISYADFVTLLFAFFVVMYSISSVNVAKYKSLSEGMKSAFNKKDQNKATENTAVLNNGPETKNTKGEYTDGMEFLKKSLSGLEDASYQINRQEGWIEINIQAGALFDSGTSELKSPALLKLMDIAGKVKNLPYTVVVEGYTDNIPIETPQFPSNWELSASRAATVGRALNSFGVPAEHILVTGYGEQYPVADNSTENGRSLNRRVSIVIVKDRSVNRLFNPQIDQAHSSFIDVGSHVESTNEPKKDDDSKKKELQ